MKHVRFVLLAATLAGCAAPTPEPAPTLTLTPTPTLTATATATDTPTPTATLTPTPAIPTPTPPVYAEPVPLYPSGWQNVRIDRLCLDVREYYTNVTGGFTLSLASYIAQELGLLGMEVVQVGEACDATLTFNWTMAAVGGVYVSGYGTSQTRTTCYTGADVRGDVRLVADSRAYTAYFHESKATPDFISPALGTVAESEGGFLSSDLFAGSCPEEPAGAPFPVLWPEAMQEQLLLLWGPPVVHAAVDTGDVTLQQGALQALRGADAGFDDHTIITLLLHAMESESEIVRRYATNYLGDFVDDELAVVGLVLALDDPDHLVRRTAAEGLGKSEAATDEIVAALIETLQDPAETVRVAAAASLGEIGPVNDDVIPTLLVLVEGEDCVMAGAAAQALGTIGPVDDQIVPALMGALQRHEEDCAGARSGAAIGLGRLGLADDDIIQGLVGALTDEEMVVRWRAAVALAEIGPDAAAAIPSLLQALDDSERSVRNAAADALAAITGEDFGTDADAWQAWWDDQSP
jgi:HEAT repeat protein